MNLPNKITIFRIILVIPLICLFSIFTWYVSKELGSLDFSKVGIKSVSQYFLYGAGFVFIIAMFSDFLDGYLARKHNQITSFGKLFDPIADKVIVTTTMIFLVVFNYSYIYLLIVFVLRDIFVDGSRNLMAKNNLKIEASIWGKIKTIVQSIALPLIIFLTPLINNQEWWAKLLLNVPLIISAILSLVSCFDYAKVIWPLIIKSK